MSSTQTKKTSRGWWFTITSAGAVAAYAYTTLQPAPDYARDNERAISDPSEISLRDAFNVYPSLVQSDLKVCFNYLTAYTIRSAGYKAALQASVDNNQAFMRHKGSQSQYNGTFLSGLPIDIRDELLIGLAQYKFDDTKASVLSQIFGDVKAEQFPPQAMLWLGARFDEYAARLAADEFLIEMVGKSSWTTSDMQAVAQRIAIIQYHVFLSEFDTDDRYRLPSFQFVNDDPDGQAESRTLLGFYEGGQWHDTITVIASRASGFRGMMSTIAHEVSHSMEGRLLDYISEGTLKPDHPIYDLVVLWKEAKGNNYSSESHEAYFHNPVEFMARIAGDVAKRYAGSPRSWEHRSSDVSGLTVEGKHIQSHVNATRARYAGQDGTNTCGQVLQQNGLRITK